MPEHLTKKSMRTDGFAIAVENNFEYLSEHRKQLIQYGAIALVVLLFAFGVFFYMGHQKTLRQDALGTAIQIQETPVTPGATSPGPNAFLTDAAKQDAAKQAFTGVVSSYSGSREGAIAEYYLGCIAADAGKLDEARKHFQTVSDSSDKDYASLASYSLADVDYIENRNAEGEKLLRHLMDNPTMLLSKDQSTIALARHLGKTNPAEAKKLLEPIARGARASSQAAVSALGEIK